MKQLGLVLALSSAGCSFFLTRGPSDTNHPPRSLPDCTTSMTYPIVDGVLAGLFLTAVVSAIVEDDQSATNLDDSEASKAEKITSAALFTGVAGLSAYLGYTRVSKCRAARGEFAAAYPNGMQPYGYPYGYGQQPYPQPYPPQSYPQPAQPQPYPAPPPMTAPPRPTAPPPTTAPPTTPATPAPAALGTEGDVCASNSECATGLTCTANVCVRPPPRK